MKLDVWIDGANRPAGALESLDNGTVIFRYTERYLATETMPLSQSLPLQFEPFGDVLTRAFFDNLLPENDQTRQLIEREGISRDDIVGILSHLGADCSGAISCLPEGSAPVKVPGDLTTDYEAMSETTRASIMTSLMTHQRLPDETNDPSPLAGVQGKMALTILPSGQWALPRSGQKVPSTHILKVPRFDNQADVNHEWAACVLMRGMGLPTSVPARVSFSGVNGLLIERFDRIVHDGRVVRLHQEDFAQALGLPRILKYERNGTPERSFNAGAAAGLIDRLRVPVQGKSIFVLATLINLALGNNDNHAKNHALLYAGGATPIMAPLYDILPIRLNDHYTDRLAFNIGSASRFEELTSEDLQDFFARFGFEGTRYRRFLETQIKPRLERLDEYAEELNGRGMKGFDDLLGGNLMRLGEILNLDLKIRPRDLFVANGGGWLAGS